MLNPDHIAQTGQDPDGVSRYRQADASPEKPKELTEKVALAFIANKEKSRVQILDRYRKARGIKTEPVKEVTR